MMGSVDMAARLHTEGYRLTPQRQLVWDTLRRANEHLTAEQIHDEVTRVAPQINLASVYRSLALLSELGLAREVQLGEGIGRWEVNHPDDAFHLVCRVCGTVDHHPGDLVDSVRRHLTGDHGFRPEAVDLVVHGVCPTCALASDNSDE
jgi:Fur family transcriptional regulator, ferric uptake regulator